MPDKPVPLERSAWLPKLWLGGSLPLGAVFGIGLGLLMLVAVGSVLLLALQTATENTTKLMRDKIDLAMEASEARVQNYLDPVEKSGLFLQRLLERGDASPGQSAAVAEILRASMAGLPQIFGIALLADQDRLLVEAGFGRDEPQVTSGTPETDIARRVLRLNETGGPRWLPPVWSDAFHQTLLAYYLPIRRDGEFLGRLVLAVAIRDLSEDISEVAYTGTTPFILLGRSRVLAHPHLVRGLPGGGAENALPTLGEIGDAVLAQMWNRQREPLSLILADKDAGHVVRIDGGEQAFVYRTIDDYGTPPWIIGLHVPSAVAGVELGRLTNLGTMSVALLLVAVCLAFFIGRGMGRPLMAVAAAAEAVRGLDLSKVPELPRSRFRELDTAATAFNAMVATLRRFEMYIPRALAHRVLRDGGTLPAPQIREVTIMMTDIVGYTARSAELGAEETARYLDEHFALIGACIQATQGTIDKYIGDSVMAFWGAPTDQPDHAARAAGAALMIAQKIAERNATCPEEPLRLRIGLSSGDGLVGNIGAPSRINYTVIGEVVNLAQRFEQLGKLCAPEAEVAILMTEETASALGPAFKVTFLGTRQIRGLPAAMKIYALASG